MDRHHVKKTKATSTFEDIAQLFIDLTELLRPPERLTLTEAAEKYVRLNNPGAYIGPYRPDIAPYMTEPADVLASREFTSCVFVGPAQTGKALALDTPIATPTGWTTMGEIKTGDFVYGDDGRPVRVKKAHPVMHGNRCYKVTFDDGSDIIADAGHLWDVDDDCAENSKIITTEEISKNVKWRRNRFRYAVRNARPLEQPDIKLPVDPYTLGVWLGDGHSNASRLTIHKGDVEIADYIRSAGHEVAVVPVAVPGANTVTLKLDPYRGAGDRRITIRQAMADFDLLPTGDGTEKWCRKHIPNIYLRASVEQRTQLLRGLMDSDGWVDKGRRCGFCTTKPELAEAVYELLVSLGYKVGACETTPTCLYKGSVSAGKRAYILTFCAYPTDPVPFRLVRKVQKLTACKSKGRPTHSKRRRITSVEKISSVPVRCIAVDNASRLFLAGRQMVPTHNTQSLILNWAAYSVKVDPMDMIIYCPTQSAARDFSMRRVGRMHRDSPEIGMMQLRDPNSDNKHDKHYKTGMILNLSWPSVSEFAGRPIGRVALTDYDRMPADIEGDGNPFDLGSKRTTTFGSFAMTLAESSPSMPVTDPKWLRSTLHEAPPCDGILGLYNRGDRRRLYWPCAKCGQYFEGKWELLKWEGKATILESAETVVMVCPINGCEIKPDQRRGMLDFCVWLKDGQYIDADGNIVGNAVRSKTASFWMNGTAAAFTTWVQLVATFLSAKEQYDRTGSEEELKKFFNTDLGEPFIPKSAAEERRPEELKQLCEPFPYKDGSPDERIERLTSVGGIEPLVPADVRFLIGTIDVQQNMFVVQIHGVAPGIPFDVLVVDRFKIIKSRRVDLSGDTQWCKPGVYPEDWDEITTEVLRRSYELSDGSGRRMTIKYTVCDSAGQTGATTNAYEYYRRIRTEGYAARFHLVRGVGLPNAPRTAITYPDSNQRGLRAAARGDVPVMHFNSNVLKDTLVGRLQNKDNGKGRFRFGNWLPDWWYAEMCAERRTDKGWERTQQKRNEGFDLSYYAIGLLVSPLLSAEFIKWEAPPNWADTWDKNSLIVDKAEKVAFAKPAQPSYDFSSFGKQLG